MIDKATRAAPRSTHRIRDISGSNPEDVAKIARLHMKLLDFGPMSGLGEAFVREIGYAAPLRDHLLKAALYEVGEEPVGFIAYTTRSHTFHVKTLTKHWMLAAWILTCSFFKEPRLAGRLLRAIKVILSRRTVPNGEEKALGEIAALAVLPEYTDVQFFRRSGVRVSDELFRHAAAHLHRAGVSILRGFVDANNRAPLFMYQRFGACFLDYQQAGEPMVQARVDLGRNLFHPSVDAQLEQSIGGLNHGCSDRSGA